jgi:hypothetical protein
MTKTKIIKWGTCGLVIFLLILMLSGTVLTHDRGDGTIVTTGGYQVILAFPERIKIGRNPMSVKILDGAGIPVSGAQVQVSTMPVKYAQQQAIMNSGMHMMNGMHGMHHDMSGMNPAPSVARSHGLQRMPGDYFGVVPFSAPGHWTLNTHFNINDQMFDANFPVNVVESHPASFAIFAGFAGLNALIIWAASVFKRRPISD